MFTKSEAENDTLLGHEAATLAGADEPPTYAALLIRYCTGLVVAAPNATCCEHPTPTPAYSDEAHLLWYLLVYTLYCACIAPKFATVM